MAIFDFLTSPKTPLQIKWKTPVVSFILWVKLFHTISLLVAKVYNLLCILALKVIFWQNSRFDLWMTLRYWRWPFVDLWYKILKKQLYLTNLTKRQSNICSITHKITKITVRTILRYFANFPHIWGKPLEYWQKQGTPW